MKIFVYFAKINNVVMIFIGIAFILSTPDKFFRLRKRLPESPTKNKVKIISKR